MASTFDFAINMPPNFFSLNKSSGGRGGLGGGGYRRKSCLHVLFFFFFSVFLFLFFFCSFIFWPSAFWCCWSMVGPVICTAVSIESIPVSE